MLNLNVSLFVIKHVKMKLFENNRNKSRLLLLVQNYIKMKI